MIKSKNLNIAIV